MGTAMLRTGKGEVSEGLEDRGLMMEEGNLQTSCGNFFVDHRTI
jgi:hypothetical protein